MNFSLERRKLYLATAVKNSGDVILLGVSAVFGLSKLLLFRYIFDAPEFGSYALAIVYSQLLSGFYCNDRNRDKGNLANG